MALLRDVLPAGVDGSPLLAEALTHRSAGSRHNERLEFLGDSILGLIIAEFLHAEFGSATEGDLSRLRASLVNRETLAGIARELRLGELLQLGQGEMKSGGHRRESTLADALEAVIAAVYLTHGLAATRDFVVRVYGARLQTLPDAEALKDPKTRLQEVLQGRNLAVPEYDIVEVTGKAHNQHFRAVCRVPELAVEAEGEGTSRRKAEQAAAVAVLSAMREAGALKRSARST